MGNTIIDRSAFSNTSLGRKPSPSCQLVTFHAGGEGKGGEGESQELLDGK